MIYLMLESDGTALAYATLKRKSDKQIEVPEDFFVEYPQPCWEFNGTDIVLKADADATRDILLTPVVEVVVPPKVSPIQFKLLFTAQERVAIRKARATDEILDDFFGIVEDQRLTYVDLALQSTQDALSYLVLTGLLTAARKEVVMRGIVV